MHLHWSQTAPAEVRRSSYTCSSVGGPCADSRRMTYAADLLTPGMGTLLAQGPARKALMLRRKAFAYTGASPGPQGSQGKSGGFCILKAIGSDHMQQLCTSAGACGRGRSTGRVKTSWQIHFSQQLWLVLLQAATHLDLLHGSNRTVHLQELDRL